MYGNLYKYGNSKISVLTARYNCTNGIEITPKREMSEYIHQLKYLRAPYIKCRNTLHTLWVLLRYDLPIQINALFTAYRLIKNNNFDVVCIGELQELGWLGAALKTLTSVKVIIFVHGEELTTSTSSRFLGKHGGSYLNKADGIVSVSEFTKRTITELFGVAENKIHLVPNGIDMAAYQTPATLSDITNQYKESGKPLIFSIGRLIERKGFDKAIEAIHMVRSKHPDVQLVIAGTGDMKNKLENLIDQFELASVVTLVGRVSHEELLSFYQACDIFLMPNRELENGDTEGFGLVFLEANAFKKPVIGGNAGGAVDAILHAKTGLLVDSTSVQEIADAIVQLLENDKLRKEMGEAGYQWAQKNDVKNKVKDFLDYCELISSAQG